MPIVTTLHTILARPSLPQRRVIDEIAETSQRLVVMSSLGASTLADVYGIAPDRIDVIPHGIPAVPARLESKRRLGVEGRMVLLTFGLLSPDKGIEYVIDALPAIVASCPSVVYIVLGATHPHVKDGQGEAYRLMLEARARQLGVDEHVIFHDRFVEQDELNEFLGAADIYITPYLNPEQSTSGTLAYAVGLGQRGHLDAVRLRARDARRRSRRAGAVPRRRCDQHRGPRSPRPTTSGATRSAAAPPATAAACSGRPSPAATTQTFARARARAGQRRARDASRRRRWPGASAACRRSTCATCAP